MFLWWDSVFASCWLWMQYHASISLSLSVHLFILHRSLFILSPFCPMYPPISFHSSQLRKDHPKRLQPDWHEKKKSYCWYCSFISCFPLYSVHKQHGGRLREPPSTKFLHSEHPATSPTQTSLPLCVVLVTWMPWIPVVTAEILHYWNKILNLF